MKTYGRNILGREKKLCAAITLAISRNCKKALGQDIRSEGDRGTKQSQREHIAPM